MNSFQKILTAVFLIMCMLFVLSAVLTPSLNKSANRWEYSPSNYYTNSLDRMPKNSLDVVFLGSSQVYDAISPMEMWKVCGIAGYNVATSGQTAPTSYYYLHRLLRSQTPKVVAIDSLALFSQPSDNEFNNRSAVDNMPMSPEKIGLAWATWKTQKNGESLASYFFPVLRYHGRWKDLKDTDFTLWQPYDYARGYDMRYGTSLLAPVQEADFPILTQAPTTAETPLNPDSVVWFFRIMELCREHGVQVLLIRTPCAGWSMEDHNAMRKFAEENGMDFLDFNESELWESIGFHPEMDMLDSMHLNYTGACKLSCYFAELLSGHYALPDHRTESDYAFWTRDFQVYLAELHAWQIQHSSQEEQLRRLVFCSDCELLGVGMENANAAISEELGIAPNPDSMWIAHWDGELSRVLYTDSLADRFFGLEIEIDDTGIYTVGRNYMTGDGGFYYVVYSKTIGKIIDYGSIDPQGVIIREQPAE